MRLFAAVFVPLFLAFASGAATAQTQTFTIGGGMQFAPEQKYLFEAANAFVQGDFSTANSLYSQAISLNANNTDAYLQRAAVRRELGDNAGMQADAQRVIELSNRALEQNPHNPNAYYERGMAHRLLKEFDDAKADITKGMRIGGKSNWQTDLKAIEMERKYAE